MSDAIDLSKSCQPSFEKALEIAIALGLSIVGVTSSKPLAELYPKYFRYNPNNRKLNYTPNRKL